MLGSVQPRMIVNGILRAFGIPCWATVLHRKCGIGDCAQFRNAAILSKDHDASRMGREASGRRVVFSSIGDLNPVQGDSMRGMPPGKARIESLPPDRREGRQPDQRLQGLGRNTLLASSLRYTASSIFSVFFPSDCRICSLPLTNISRLPLCPECLEAMSRFEGRRCAVCGERMFGFGPEAVQLCRECLKEHPAFEKASAYGSYDGGLRELIHLLKYDRVRSAAPLLGRMLAEAMTDLRHHFAVETALMVPVPLHSSKLRSRGFNQSELIAESAVKGDFRSIKLRPQVLTRVRATESQTGLTREQRRENMRGAFAVSLSDEVGGRDILVVDDVLTTGTTVCECARVLRKSGAARVWVVTVARVMKPEMTAAMMPEQEPEEALTMSAHAG